MTSRYAGSWRCGAQEGYGVHTWADRAICSGEFKNGIQDGPTVYEDREGCSYKGWMHNDRKNGFGIYTYSDTTCERYCGQWCDDVRHGDAVSFDLVGTASTEHWSNNIKLSSVQFDESDSSHQNILQAAHEAEGLADAAKSTADASAAKAELARDSALAREQAILAKRAKGGTHTSSAPAHITKSTPEATQRYINALFPDGPRQRVPVRLLMPFFFELHM